MYTRPVTPTGISSWLDHTRRNPPSQEAGVDYYCPTGTPVKAAGNGRIYACAGGVGPATGRYITLDLDDGRRVRYLHLKDWACRPGDRVSQGQIIGYSGASGYGSEFFGEPYRNAAFWANTGGDHVHATLWPSHAYSFGTNAGTLDFEVFTGGSTAGGTDSTAFPEPDSQEDDMALTIYKRGASIRVVGDGRDFRIGGELTRITGVDGQEMLNALTAGGAKVVELNDRQWDVLNVTLTATAPKQSPLDEAFTAKLVDALVAKLPVATGGVVDGAVVKEAVDAAIAANVAAIAKAAADEEDRRDRERLG